MDHIHIVGASPRTGTTLVLEAIKSCYDIGYSVQHEGGIVTRPPYRCNLFLTKNPLDGPKLMPSIYFDKFFYVIYMLRDPRDIICSKHPNHDEKYFVDLDVWNSLLWVYKKLKLHPRFIPVKYEKLVSNPSYIQKKIENNTPLPKRKKEFINYHEDNKNISKESSSAMRGKRKIDDSSVGRWENHIPRVRRQIEKYPKVLSDISELGYENGKQWALNIGINIDEVNEQNTYVRRGNNKSRSSLDYVRYRECFKRTLELIRGGRYLDEY